MKHFSLPAWACPRRIILASTGLLLLVTGQVVVFRALTPADSDDGARQVAQIEPAAASVATDVSDVEDAELGFYGARDFKSFNTDREISYAPQTGLALDHISLPHSLPLTEEPAQRITEDKPLLKPLQARGAKIAIVIDDMGINKKMSAEVLDKLPSDITLSFLPYAPHVQSGIDEARADGHEVILHIPMQPLSSTENAGPDALTVSMSEDEIRQKMQESIGALHGYTGMNNHMGSRFTSDASSMNAFMDVIAGKGAYFLDSRTIGNSKGAEMAARHGVSFASRDVFLDHAEDRASVDKQLRSLEQAALKNGSAIAIGHPKVNTIAALESWIEDARSRGFEIVPLKSLVHQLPTPHATTALAEPQSAPQDLGNSVSPVKAQ